jgi:hypothetical protein
MFIFCSTCPLTEVCLFQTQMRLDQSSPLTQHEGVDPVIGSSQLGGPQIHAWTLNTPWSDHEILPWLWLETFLRANLQKSPSEKNKKVPDCLPFFVQVKPSQPGL